MIGLCLLEGSAKSTGLSSSLILIGSHWLAPAGLFFNSHSYSRSNLKYELSHLSGLVVQAPSIPLVTCSTPNPPPSALFQPKPCCSTPAASGSAPNFAASPLP